MTIINIIPISNCIKFTNINIQLIQINCLDINNCALIFWNYINIFTK